MACRIASGRSSAQSRSTIAIFAATSVDSSVSPVSSRFFQRSRVRRAIPYFLSVGRMPFATLSAIAWAARLRRNIVMEDSGLYAMPSAVGGIGSASRAAPIYVLPSTATACHSWKPMCRNCRA
jgi:hypothetical protein